MSDHRILDINTHATGYMDVLIEMAQVMRRHGYAIQWHQQGIALCRVLSANRGEAVAVIDEISPVKISYKGLKYGEVFKVKML